MKNTWLITMLVVTILGCGADPDTGTVLVELSDYDVEATITVDGSPIEVTELRQPFQFSTGTHQLDVSGPEIEKISEKFIVAARDDNVLRIELARKRALPLPDQGSTKDRDTEVEAVVSRTSETSTTESADEPGGISESASTDIVEARLAEDSDDRPETVEMTDRERQFISWVRSIGGEVVVGNGIAVGFSNDSEFTPDDFFRISDLPHLHTLVFDGYGLTSGWINGPHLNDDAIMQLSGLPSLRVFGGRGKGITDRSMEHLGRFPIKSLTIRDGSISDEGLTFFSRHQFDFLNISGSPGITDQGLRAIDCSMIKTFNLTDTGISNATFKRLAEWPQLKVFLAARTSISDDGVNELIIGLRKRRSAVPTDDPNVDGSNDFELALKRLDISSTQISTSGLANIASAFPQLTSLHVRRLKSTPTETSYWSGFKNLQGLDLYFTRINDRQLRDLIVLSNLKNLGLTFDESACTATRQSIIDFHAALPDCKINGKPVNSLIAELPR